MRPRRTPPRYGIRRNPGTGRWVMYCRDFRPDNPARARYRIMGDADTYANALAGIYS